ncbi:hypothetical protein M1316_00625 [Candidatus Parvarchaeota archaeon]|nr:hypothetical protein [Candidatus Parvarchaeota archaeon]
MMEQGILLVVVSLIIIVIGGVILVIFSLSFLTSVGAAQFGGKCYFSFVEYNVLNNFLYPAQYLANLFLIENNNAFTTSLSSSVQASCIQQSNVNAQDTSTLGEQLYSKAASCFNLFQGSNANVGQQIITSGLNNLFECYSGKILTSESPGTQTTYSELINYINQNYPNNGSPIQIVFLTNGSGNAATYPLPNQRIFNGTNYIIYYFNYPFSQTKQSSMPSNCSISFGGQCSYTSSFDQPVLSNPATQCSYANDTINEAVGPVSSLSSGNPFGYNSNNNNKFGVCGDFLISLCGKLINAMVGTQDRAFVCITNSTQ